MFLGLHVRALTSPLCPLWFLLCPSRAVSLFMYIREVHIQRSLQLCRASLAGAACGGRPAQIPVPKSTGCYHRPVPVTGTSHRWCRCTATAPVGADTGHRSVGADTSASTSRWSVPVPVQVGYRKVLITQSQHGQLFCTISPVSCENHI
jgi:hypothetical protein